MKIIATLLMASATLLAPVALPAAAVAATRVALACPADAPEGWKRPGGYCEQRNTLDTLGTEKGNGVSCRRMVDVGSYLQGPLGDRLLMATEIYDPCCNYGAAAPSAYLPDGLLSRSDETILVSIC